MRQGLAVSLPSASELESHAKTLAALGGIVGGLWVVISKWWRRKRQAARVKALEAKAIRYLLDSQRHTLETMLPNARLLNLSEMERQKHLIDTVRDELWVADGHESEREAERRAEELERFLTRTQAIKVKQQQQQDMFKEP